MITSFFLFWLSVVGRQVTGYFPNGRCYDRDCDFAPYLLEKVVDEGPKVCFAIRAKECKESEYNCCSKFFSQLNKIVLSSVPVCNRSLQMVTLNGVRKGGGVFFDLYGNKSAEVRITSMSLSYNTALSTEICLHLRNECDTWREFCGECKYAIFDPYQHTCCPTCSFQAVSLPPSPPPPPTLASPPPAPVPPSPAAEEPPVAPPQFMKCNQCSCTQCTA
jgi:hypothetical protein